MSYINYIPRIIIFLFPVHQWWKFRATYPEPEPGIVTFNQDEAGSGHCKRNGVSSFQRSLP
jgi:hypothetical protein